MTAIHQAVLSKSLNQGSGLDQEFRLLTEQYARAIVEAGGKATPYRSREVPHFKALSPEVQRKAIHDIRMALEVFQEMAAAGHSLKDSPKLLWRSLRKLGVVPCSDIFDRIEDGDVVNVYSLDQKIIFQNLHFFDYISLTVEEIYSTQWYNATVRPEKVQAELYKVAVAVLSGQTEGTVDPGVEEHICEEAYFAGASNSFWIKVKWASPYRKNGQIDGMIVINRCWGLTTRHMPQS